MLRSSSVSPGPPLSQASYGKDTGWGQKAWIPCPARPLTHYATLIKLCLSRPIWPQFLHLKQKGCAKQYRRVAPLALIVSVSRPEAIASGYSQTFFCLSYTVFEFFFQLVGNTGKISHINLNVRRSRKILSFHCCIEVR